MVRGTLQKRRPEDKELDSQRENWLRTRKEKAKICMTEDYIHTGEELVCKEIN
jgi:hypothetical protein